MRTPDGTSITLPQLKGLMYYDAIFRGVSPRSVGLSHPSKTQARLQKMGLIASTGTGVVITKKGKSVLDAMVAGELTTKARKRNRRMINNEQRRARVLDAVGTRALGEAQQKYPGSSVEVAVRAARYAYVIGCFRKALNDCMQDQRAFMNEFDQPE